MIKKKDWDWNIKAYTKLNVEGAVVLEEPSTRQKWGVMQLYNQDKASEIWDNP